MAVRLLLPPLMVLASATATLAQQPEECFGAGDIAGAVLGTLLCTLLLITLLYFMYAKFWLPRREKHLVLETDPETGDKYAFDNPCFKDAGLTPIGKVLDKSGGQLDSGKSKWNQWSPLGALVSNKTAKKKTMDDTCVENTETRVVSLRSHDFTGLGFNIYGNMRDGIFIKDVLHRGPASESGKLNPGDKINSVQISFEHMVYEDALTILSYASPYEVQIEVRSGAKSQGPTSGQGAQPKHPLFRSSSSTDLLKIGKSAKQRLFQTNNLDNSVATEYSSINVSSANTTLERSAKQSPRTDVNNLPKPERAKKTQSSSKPLSPEQLKTQLEHNLSQKITTPPEIPVEIRKEKKQKETKADLELQTSEADTKKGFQKFGVRVLPLDLKLDATQPRSPKSSELSQNDNNINLEKNFAKDNAGTDEVDMSKEAKQITNEIKRETTNEPSIEDKPEENFHREDSLNSSGIKRDKAGIPQEIPDHMFKAAVAARKNRRSIDLTDKSEDESEVSRTPKKLKGKAPAPPDEKHAKVDKMETNDVVEKRPVASVRLNFTDNFDEIIRVDEKETEPKTQIETVTNTTDESITHFKMENEKEKMDEVKEYCSDSDMETDNQSSVNTIELNSSDITIHQSEENNEMKGRKTASTGDLSKLQKTKVSSGTLERAQSLDITDSGIPTLTKKRKATKDHSDSKLSSDESLYENTALKNKEPRLSLALDGHETFQRNRLKKSSEWGNLEDVVLNLDKVEEPTENFKIELSHSPVKFDFGTKDTEFETTPHTNMTLDETKTIEPAIHTKDTNNENDSSCIEEELIQETRTVKNLIWPTTYDSVDQIDETKTTNDINSIESITVKPVKTESIVTETKRNEIYEPKENTETTFSLKAQFQEKLNGKLKQTENETQVPKPPPSFKLAEDAVFNTSVSSQDFIFAEKFAANNDVFNFTNKLYDTNISDDIKVSRHSLGSLERPKSDVLKSVNKLKMQSLISSDQGGVSNITITENKSYENGINKNILEINTPNEKKTDITYDMSTASELYTTALDNTVRDEKDDENVNSNELIISPDIKNITITETITDTKYLSEGPSSLTIDTSSDGPESIKSNTLTFITEIQVTPNSHNVSEVEVTPEKENSSEKIEELTKLPEMKFTTSSYEAPKTPEKRISQIELLRSNFEKSPPKPSKMELSPSKSRIPIAMSKIELKTSPERRELKFDDQDEKEIVEIMSSAVHSTPIVTNQRIGSKNPSRNVTVTSIRTSSKIPSGQHSSISYNNKPPVPARPHEHIEIHESRTVSSNGNSESSFKQWVFNPSDSSITSIILDNKEPQK